MSAAVCNESKNLEFCWSHHSQCDFIGANQTKFYLSNDEPTTVRNCDCDLEFYNCLHRIDSSLANRIGNMYFSHQKRCFRVDYLIDSCNEYDMSPIGTEYRCIEYLLNIQTSRTNQFFDLPYYHGKASKPSKLIVKS